MGLWFGSLLVAITLFSLLLAAALGSTLVILVAFRIAMTVALPAWCLCLPVVIMLKDAEEGRLRTILVSGALIGPVTIAVVSFFLQLKGSNSQTIWFGDPLLGVLGGGIAAMIFAFLGGSFAAALYVLSLKVLHRHAAST